MSKKRANVIIFIILLVMCFLLFSSCGADYPNEYKLYVAYSQEQGVKPLSYEEWLNSIKGDAGEKGESAFEIFKKYYEYDGTEEQWINNIIYGKWMEIYIVEFEQNSLPHLPSILPAIVLKNHLISEPETLLEKYYGERYDIEGWYLDDACTRKWNFDTDTVQSNMVLYANCIDHGPYTVDIMAVNDKGEVFPTMSSLSKVEKGSKITAPELTGLGEYLIEGWYTDRACTIEWNFATDTVQSNMILYAKVVYNGPLSVSFVIVDDEGNIKYEYYRLSDVEKDSKIVVPEFEEIQGYTIDGWYKDRQCTHIWDFDNEIVTRNNMCLFGKLKPKEAVKVQVYFGSPIKYSNIGLEYTNGDDILSVFNPTTNQWSSHKGVDLVAADGTDVVSMFDGVVINVMNIVGLGNIVVVDHGDNVIATYASLDDIVVLKGQNVKKGDKLGVASTTASDELMEGAHLHLEINVNGRVVDPMPYVKGEIFREIEI